MKQNSLHSAVSHLKNGVRALAMITGAGLGLVSSTAATNAPVASIYGKIQLVDSFPDYKVQVVDSFADLHVQKVSSFPDGAGKWQIVDSFPDFKIQIVESFPDFTIKYVESFPGVQ
jgi:hypothetical protein